MVRLKPERFQAGVAKKLHAHSFGLFKILKRIGPDVYILNLPADLGISLTFNVEDLVPYHTIASPFTYPCRLH